MAITPVQIAAAQALSLRAHDPSLGFASSLDQEPANPLAIEERPLGSRSGCDRPEHLCHFLHPCLVGRLAVTGHAYCAAAGHANARCSVQRCTPWTETVANRRPIAAYPVPPLVLDNWETGAFLITSSWILTRRYARTRKIRADHDAFGHRRLDAPNLDSAGPPISAAERGQFNVFHGPRTQVYACVLPGEIIRQCVQAGRGVIDPWRFLHIEHLVVDEFQGSQSA